MKTTYTARTASDCYCCDNKHRSRHAALRCLSRVAKIDDSTRIIMTQGASQTEIWVGDQTPDGSVKCWMCGSRKLKTGPRRTYLQCGECGFTLYRVTEEYLSKALSGSTQPQEQPSMEEEVTITSDAAPPSGIEVSETKVEAYTGLMALFDTLIEGASDGIMDKVTAKTEALADELKKIAENLRPRTEKIEIEVNGELTATIGTEVVHPVFRKVLTRFKVQEALKGARLKPVLLVGPAGCGKSYLGEQIAKAMGLPFYSQGLSGGISESAFFGRLVPQGESGSFEFLTTPFLTAYENGGVFLLDELDAGDENMILALNNAIANGHASVPNRAANPVALRNENFYLLGSCNTYGRGSDRIYVGRNTLDDSTLDRFRMGTYDMDYDRELEKRLVSDDKLLQAWWGVRAKVEEAKIRRTVSTRALVDAHDERTALKTPIKALLQQLATGWSDAEKKQAGI